ncbi:MAG: BtaA family protein, partial [Nitrospirae bacterium]|nr:BtaA family protein [Nitrospirota bacterium]
MVPFLETLNYSSSNEDGRSEIKALGIKGQDSVLCITGSGARPLDLLTQVPKEIVSVDFNPCQNFLLELKMESIRCLDYEEFLQFIGVRPCRTRGYLYKGIQQSLSTGAKSFWDSHPEMIQKGVLYAGRWERYFRRLALFISLVRPRLLSRLFGSDGVREQSRIWHERWNNVSWRVFLRLVSSRMFWRHAFGDPGFFLYVQRGFSIYRYLNERFASAVENMLLRDLN